MATLKAAAVSATEGDHDRVSERLRGIQGVSR
jgi:hypothetical protein